MNYKRHPERVGSLELFEALQSTNSFRLKMTKPLFWSGFVIPLGLEPREIKR